MKQSTSFMLREGDKYYQRNLGKSREPDPVFAAIKDNRLKPHTVLEVGCGDGWRLRKIRAELGPVCYGIDPSKDAINDAPQSIEKYGISCWRGTAENLVGVGDNSIEVVIYGFCLYLVDREDLFRVVAECDRVLRDGGHIVIHDFHSARPYSRVYEHEPSLRSFKQDYSQLWLANPAYKLMGRQIFGVDGPSPGGRDDQVVVAVLKKDMENAYPLEPLYSYSV